METYQMQENWYSRDRASVRTSTLTCKSGWNFAFKLPARIGGKSHGHQDFSLNNKKQQQSLAFFSTKF